MDMELFRILHKDNTHLKYTRAKTRYRDVHEHEYTRIMYTQTVIIWYDLNTYNLLVMFQ